MMDFSRTSRLRPLYGLVCGMGLLLTGFLLLLGCQPPEANRIDTKSEPADRTRQVVALGRLEPYEGILSIGAIPGQRLKSLQPQVKEGAILKIPLTEGLNSEGTHEENNPQEKASPEKDPYLLGLLDTHAVRQTQLQALITKKSLAIKKQQGEIRLADVQLLQAKATYQQALAKMSEVESQQPRLDNLKEAAELTQNQYLTLVRLHQDDPELVSPSQLARQKNQSERAVLEYQAAEISMGPTLEAAEATLNAASLSMKVAQANCEQIQEVGKFQLAALEMEIEAARQMLVQAELRLPPQKPSEKQIENEEGNPKEVQKWVEYTILEIFIRPGEFITQLPILKVGNLSRMACVAEVYEADAKQIHVGQQAQLHSPAFSGQFAPNATSGVGSIQGTVRRISKIITSPGLSDRNPLAPMDRSVVKVMIEIDDKNLPAIQEAAKLVGLQVTVKFKPKTDSPVPHVNQISENE